MNAASISLSGHVQALNLTSREPEVTDPAPQAAASEPAAVFAFEPEGPGVTAAISRAAPAAVHRASWEEDFLYETSGDRAHRYRQPAGSPVTGTLLRANRAAAALHHLRHRWLPGQVWRSCSRSISRDGSWRRRAAAGGGGVRR
ncbi:hypothetical protein [Streptomyces sp. SBT349]|uniref:hypothetical protein n=1 Tax=Streptomyces sp. SBT349 TaxID=1580539 RepID=UPI00066A7E44|nr:hypothetical protein [Streptomyces sp. SBT349]